MSTFPRTLSFAEKEFLEWLLPSDVAAYEKYHDFIQSAKVLGEGRWGSGDLILSQSTNEIDMTLGMSPIIAYGECMIAGTLLTISIHDIDIDDHLEAQFSGLYPLPDGLTVEAGWTYSYWKPGDVCPATGKVVRTVEVKVNDELLYVIAVSSEKQTMWLHHTATQWNQLLPITAFYDELLRTHGIRDEKFVLHPKTFFEKIDEFTDDDFRKALVEYSIRTGDKLDRVKEVVVVSGTKRNTVFSRILGKK